MNVADIISRGAARSPLAVAIAGPAGNIDYRTLDRAIWRAAAQFRRAGIAPGDVVGISFVREVLHLVGSYALARLGATQLSLSLRDSEAVRRRLAARFNASRVLVDTDLDARWLSPGDEPVDQGLRAAGGEAGWMIVLSSGTTGEPKGALRTHAMALAACRIQSAATALSSADRCHTMVGLDYLVGLGRCLDAHYAGATVVLRQPGDLTPAFFDFLAAQKISFLALIAPQLEMVMSLATGPGPAAPGLRLLRLDATALTDSLRKEIRARMTPKLFHSYGTTEAGLLAYALGATLEKHPGTVGFAAPEVELQVVDEAGNPLPPGSTGRVRARTPAMVQGYIGDPQTTARTFAGGWYYPGDLGTLSPEGPLTLKGRTDEMMNFGGTKIYPGEIEAALLEHANVIEAAAFPVAARGQQHLPVAAVVMRGRDLQGLSKWCKARLGRHAPRFLFAVPRLPKNAAGKVLRRELAAMFLKTTKGRER